MSFIYPGNNILFSQNNNTTNIPFRNIYNQMQDMTSAYIKSRIIQKNLVYLIGLSAELVKIESKLKSFEYFGQYGKIVKLVINKNKVYNSNGANGPSYICFVTYSTVAESSLAILSLDDTIIDNHQLKANYGTTKYCLNFLKNWECKNKDCIYLHKLADKKDIVSREIMNDQKDVLFHQQRLMAIELSKILTNEKYSELYKTKNIKTVFPNGFSVYTKDLVIQYIKEKNLGVALNLNYAELIYDKNNNKQKGNNKKEEEEKNKEEKNINLQSKNTNKETLHNNFNDFVKNFINGKNTFNHFFKSAPKSTFSFANGNQNLTGNEISQIIPSQINNFLTQQFVRHSIFYNIEQDDINDYYFSMKNSLDSDDSWSSLVKILEKYEGDNTKKFNTY